MTTGNPENPPIRAWWKRAALFAGEVFDTLSGGGAAGVLMDRARSSHDRLERLEARVKRLEAADRDLI